MNSRKPASCASANRRVLNLVGVVILVAGLGSATSIWLEQDRIDRQTSAAGRNGADALSPGDSRRYTRDVELYYGETGMLMEKWKRWFADMTHGKPLAGIIGGVSLVSASGLFYLATRRSLSNKPQPPS